MNIKFKPLFLIFMFQLVSAETNYAQQQYDKYYTNVDFTEFLSDTGIDKSVEGVALAIDLLNATIFHLTNVERSKAKLDLLDFYHPLCQSAQLHSESMIEFDFFNHINHKQKKWKTPADRIFYYDSSYIALSENIVENNLLDYKGDVLTYRISYNDNGEEVFVDSNDVEILYSTYRTLAERLVKQWMNSKPHRENILSESYELMGCGCAIDQDKRPIIIRCTQNFGKRE